MNWYKKARLTEKSTGDGTIATTCMYCDRWATHPFEKDPTRDDIDWKLMKNFTPEEMRELQELKTSQEGRAPQNVSHGICPHRYDILLEHKYDIEPPHVRSKSLLKASTMRKIKTADNKEVEALEKAIKEEFSAAGLQIDDSMINGLAQALRQRGRVPEDHVWVYRTKSNPDGGGKKCNAVLIDDKQTIIYDPLGDRRTGGYSKAPSMATYDMRQEGDIMSDHRTFQLYVAMNADIFFNLAMESDSIIPEDF